MEAMEKVIENKFELRTLTAVDVASMTRILTKIGFGKIKSIVSSVDLSDATKKDGKINLEAIGFGLAIDFVGVILENYAAVQDLLLEWLASLTGKKKKEIEALELADFTELLICVVQKEEFKDFFKVVSKLLK